MILFIKARNNFTKKITVLAYIKDTILIQYCFASLDEIIKEAKDAGKGYREVCHADDVVIMSEDEDNLQRFLHRFELTTEKYKMSIFL